MPPSSALQQRTQHRYGPWAIVTGASDGIGRAFAEHLAESGLHLVLVARRAALLEALGAALSQKHGVEVRTVAADLGKPAGLQELILHTAQLDVGLLVACAGFGTSGQFLDAPLENELEMLDVNCRAVVVLSHHFGARFRTRKRGGLILMSSLLAFQGVPRAAHYAATKAFVQSLAEGLRLELAPHGVDVLASAPGPVASGFADRADMRMGFTATTTTVARETLTALGKRATVRPGFLSKFLEWSLALLPRWGRVRVLGAVMAGMTEHRP